MTQIKKKKHTPPPHKTLDNILDMGYTEYVLQKSMHTYKNDIKRQ